MCLAFHLCICQTFGFYEFLTLTHTICGGADTAPRYLRFASPLTGWDHPLLRYKLSALVSAQGAAAQAYTLLQVRAPASTSHSSQHESRG